MKIEIRILDPHGAHLLKNVAPDVFDEPVDAGLTAQFLTDPRHHIVVALDGDLIVGMATAVDYVHPDKPQELWINEVGVSASYHRKGIGRKIVQSILDLGRELGCSEAWVATEPSNAPAKGLYESAGGRDESAVIYAFELQSKPEE